jgi:hypothetical protein
MMLLAELGATYYIIMVALLIGVLILWKVLKARGMS